MKFGVAVRNKLTGAGLYVRAMQVSALLPALYIFVASGYPALLRSANVLTFLFGLGCSLLPRGETLAVSSLYRATGSELWVYFALVCFALAFGLLADALLRSRTAGRPARLAFAALVAADLLLRLVPLRFNLAFGWPCAVLGFLGRGVCLALILLDLRAEKKAAEKKAE
jgi:hypothetical protein